MKKIYFYSLLLTILTISFNSCLYNDDIGESTYTKDTKTGDDNIYSGQANKIDYERNITEPGLDKALEKMNQTSLLGRILSAQYALRGGKDAAAPGPHAYQYQFNLEIDNYAGYLCAPQNFGGRLRSTYYNSQDFNGGAMGSFIQVKNFIAPVLNHPQIDSIPEIKAISLLIYNLAAQEVADIYGPFPYANYKANIQKHPLVYNAVDTIYDGIVNNIDLAIACLKHYEKRPDWYKTKINEILGQYDLVSLPQQGSEKIEKWIKFANSHKLRMAMNIVKVEPAKAKRWAEDAVRDGVIETAGQELKLDPKITGGSHPLVMISNTWNDTRLNASFETILKAYKHPALEVLFTKNSNPIIDEKDPTKIFAAESGYVGLRSGIRMLPGQAYDVNYRVAYSKVSDAIITMPLFLIKLSEVQFLRAEGALRGWSMGGSAENFYNLGIQHAYDETSIENINSIYNDALAEYMGREEALEITYQDPANSNYNAESLIKVGVKWNNADNNETKLEKIITQKYIAGFPFSFVAWTDLRRTGYPKIFPVVSDDGDGSILAGDIIRRIPYTTTEEAVRKDIENTAIRVLGPDKQGTRLWWDVEKPNF